MGWPLDKAKVAHQFLWIAITLKCPAANEFAAVLPDYSQFDEFSVCLKSRFFPEFAASSRQRLFAINILALGDRPGASVLGGPEWTSRMNQENFEFRSSPTEHQ
jgi:hypothetical protein